MALDEKETDAKTLAEGWTGSIVYLHPLLVAFLALTLLARACAPDP